MSVINTVVDSSASALVFPDVGARLFIDTQDNRGKSLLKRGDISQRHVFAAWNHALDRFGPDVVLDIGANHGEMTIPRRYPAGCQVALFEPNPRLGVVLRRSIEAHPDGGRMTLHEAGVSDHVGTARMFTDEKWSGTSSLDYRAPDGPWKGEGAQTYREIEIRLVTVDAVLRDMPAQPSRVALKIDTEGHEPKVLAGATECLSRPFVMLMEFAPARIRSSGSDLAAFVARVLGLGDVFIIPKTGPLRQIRSTDELSGACDILVTNEAGTFSA